jgi:hypothetical protein
MNSRDNIKYGRTLYCRDAEEEKFDDASISVGRRFGFAKPVLPASRESRPQTGVKSPMIGIALFQLICPGCFLVSMHV